MENKYKNGVKSELGSEAQTKRIVTLQDAQTWLKRDLQICIACLDAIYKDPNTLNALAEFLHGRYLNNLHQEELKNQTELEIK